jgi:hypothetical protein
MEMVTRTITSLSSNLVAGYLDDITLGGDEKTLAHDVSTIRARGEAMGLKLNVKKCEFINKDAKATEPIFSDFILLDTANATLLGAPLTAGKAMDDALAGRCKDLALTIDRLKLLSAHDALILLRASFSAPKILHTLRSSPCAGHPTLDQFDSLLRNGLCTITNSNLSDMQWIQASLPVADGGLGIRRVASLAPSAFLASAASTHDLQEHILARSGTHSDDSLSTVRTLWTTTTNLPCPNLPSAAKQTTWDKPYINRDKSAVLDSAPDSHHRARLRSLPHMLVIGFTRFLSQAAGFV